ncbi:MAG: phosphotransferase [Methylacidiphilales bacterium]|nr:phosphotransferase [Candidatus Methylacidiphilales bacterium]
MNAAGEIESLLREDGQLSAGPATLVPLGGGVSSEILKVTQGTKTFVVKRALAKLRVAADWRADVGRNAVEYAFYETMTEPLAGSVPRVYFHNPARGYFTMECLEDGWQNWKELLLQGIIEPEHGALAGRLMGKLHASTWQDARLREKFDTTENFRQLRSDPYLRTAATHRPAAASILLAEASRLEDCHVCLVHGDFSPKNLLIKNNRMMLLDAEVAWFGEPAFDVGFLMTHLFLKGLHHAPHPTA